MLNERDNLGANASPAGGLAVSANDMARWLMIQLDGGALPNNGGRLFSEAAHDQMWTPLVLQPVGPRSGPLAATQPMFNTYALGWDVRDYRGAKIVWHGGAVFGFLTAVVLIPEKHVGFSIEINSEDGAIILGSDVRAAGSLSRSTQGHVARKNCSRKTAARAGGAEGLPNRGRQAREVGLRCRSIAMSVLTRIPGTGISKWRKPRAD